MSIAACRAALSKSCTCVRESCCTEKCVMRVGQMLPSRKGHATMKTKYLVSLKICIGANISRIPSTHCNTLQHTATHGSTLRCTSARCNTLHTATHYSMMQYTAAPCSTLAAHYNIRQYTLNTRKHSELIHTRTLMS